MSNWIFLSYPLSGELSAYGDGDRIDIKEVRSISRGDTSNNSVISLSSHLGTHIDFPLHFSNTGKNIDDYDSEFFVFKKAAVISLERKSKSSKLIIELDELIDDLGNISEDIELLIIKTGFGTLRDKEHYWKEGFGIGLHIASYLRKCFPLLKAVGFDLISLNSYQHREIGRKAHGEFLVENDILIIEDMDLSKITKNSNIELIITSPFRVKGAEAAPLTIFAKVN